MPGPLPVAATVAEARTRAAAGLDVVLIVGWAESGSLALELELELEDGTPGRVHLLIGDIADPVVQQAAEEMAAELGARRDGTGPGAAKS